MYHDSHKPPGFYEMNDEEIIISLQFTSSLFCKGQVSYLLMQVEWIASNYFLRNRKKLLQSYCDRSH